MLSTSSFRMGARGRSLSQVRLCSSRTAGHSMQEIRAVSARKLATRNCSLLRSLLITKALSNLDSRYLHDEIAPVFDDEKKSASSHQSFDLRESFSSSPSFQDYLETSCESQGFCHDNVLDGAEPACVSSASLAESEDDVVDILSVSKTPLRCKDPSLTPEYDLFGFDDILKRTSRATDVQCLKGVKRSSASEIETLEELCSKRMRSASPCSTSLRGCDPQLASPPALYCSSS
eukprot:m.224619 g.224619  ORF g.224619 m.224619 type:complete len:233 (+) comp11121_c0_seq1:126-824(+)